MRSVKKVLALLLAAALSFSLLLGAGITAHGEGEEGDGGQVDMMGVQAESYDQPISRETFCYLIVTLFAEQQGTTVDELYGKLTDHQKTEAFQDIKAEDKYISLAKKYELMEGTGEMYFSPSAAITRAEIACIIRNLTRSLVPERLAYSEAHGEAVEFEDRVEVAEWAREAAEFCVREGLLKLDQHGNFDPTNTMTVAQATMLVSDVKVLLNTPVPEETNGIPVFVWYIAGGVVALTAVIVLIVVLRNRSKRKEKARVDREQRQEAELDRLIAPSKAVAPPPGRSSPEPRKKEPKPNKKTSPKQAPPEAGRATSPGGYANAEDRTVYMQPSQAPRVRVIGRGVPERIFDLTVPVTIGRSGDCTLQLTDGTISRRHCRIAWRARSVLLEDIGARNPIHVVRGAQSIPVRKEEGVKLRSGDVIRVGALELVITIIEYR